MKTYWIGRSEQCDIQLTEACISRLHAELLIARDGRYYLTDCASSQGTFIAQDQSWKKMTQCYIEANQPLKLGDIKTSIAQLLKKCQNQSQSLKRNPETGEILL